MDAPLASPLRSTAGSRPYSASGPVPMIDVPNSSEMHPGGWLTQETTKDNPTVPLGVKAVPKRQDRWTPRSRQGAASRSESKPGTAQTQQSAQGPVVPELDIDDNLPNVNAFSRGYTEKELEEIKDIQAKIQGQLKHRRNFKVEEDNHTTLNLEHFKRTLTRYGLDLSEDESDKIFAYYDKDGGGELDHHEFIQGVRGSEFVQTARSYGFETPDPGYHNPDPEGGWGHYVDLAGTERESALTLGTPRCAKAWQQQRAVDGCPFGTDRRMFGGNWQYRTSSLIKAEPIVAPRYGKTGFPARKELSDIMHVIAEKLNERSKGALAFTRMFNQFDTDKNGSIDREEFDKLLDIFNIELTDDETKVVFDHFGATDGGIRYRPFVNTVVAQGAIHPLGGEKCQQYQAVLKLI